MCSPSTLHDLKILDSRQYDKLDIGIYYILHNIKILRPWEL